MAVKQLKDWLPTIISDERDNSILGAWMTDLVRFVRNSWYVTTSKLSSFYRAEGATGRIQERYTLGGASQFLETYFNGTRTTLNSDAAFIEYMDNGSTEIGRWDRATGYLNIKRILTNTPTPASGWSDYGSVFGPNEIRKDSDGNVTLELMYRNTSGSSKAANSTVVTLPAGYRPTKYIIGAGNRSGNLHSRVNIQTSGTIDVSEVIANNDWVNFSGITFYAGY